MLVDKSILIIGNVCSQLQCVCEALNGDGFNIYNSEDEVRGLTLARSGKHFDIIIVDLKSPGNNALECIKSIRANKTTPIVMFCSELDKFERIFGLELGADDYFTEQHEVPELVAKFRALLRRANIKSDVQSQSALTNGEFTLDTSAGAMYYKNVGIELTNTEYAILEVLWMNAGAPVNKNDISLVIFNRPLTPYDRTIDMHISNLRKKFANHVDYRCIRTLRGRGYQLANLCV